MQCGAPRTQMTFHPSIFNNGKWQCCGNTSKSDKGCRNVNELNEEKYNKPLPDLPRKSFLILLLLIENKSIRIKHQ